jgi:hypothetical protein
LHVTASLPVKLPTVIFYHFDNIPDFLYHAPFVFVAKLVK